MKKKYLAGFLLAALAGLSLLGCAKKEEEVISYELTAYAENELIDGTYYVKTNNGFYPVAPGMLSINENDMIIAENVSNDRVLWYGQDDAQIPTLYADQSLIYVTKDQIPARWVFERYEDVGYTIGLMGLAQNAGGRYETVITETSIHPYSSALLQLQTMNYGDIIGIDQIGSSKITSDYVSRGGTIIGLAKDQVYNVDVYQGSNYVKTQMSADTHAFVSYELYETAQYSYNQTTYVTIDIPDYFLSGYYYINGTGLFRYVATDSSQGISGVSFNTPYYVGIDDEGNLLTKEELLAYRTQEEETVEEIEKGNIWTFVQSIDNTMEELSMLISYSEMNKEDTSIIAAQLEQNKEDDESEEIDIDVKEPTAVLYSPTGEEYVFSSSSTEGSALSCNVKMPISGEWKVEISGMEDKIFQLTSNINSGHSNSIVHSGNGSAEMNYYLTNALYDGLFEITWENKDHAAVIVIEGPDETRYVTTTGDEEELANGDVPYELIVNDYGIQKLLLGQCIAGNYKISITGEELGRVRCSAYEYEEEDAGGIISSSEKEDSEPDSDTEENEDDEDDEEDQEGKEDDEE